MSVGAVAAGSAIGLGGRAVGAVASRVRPSMALRSAVSSAGAGSAVVSIVVIGLPSGASTLVGFTIGLLAASWAISFSYKS